MNRYPKKQFRRNSAISDLSYRYASLMVLSILVFCIIFVISPYSWRITSAIGLSIIISTIIAFRWMWHAEFTWEPYFFTMRPVFLSISYLWIIIGPLPALAGGYQYVYNYGVQKLYWVLYLFAPMAFLFYEIGYKFGLGRHPEKLIIPSRIGLRQYSIFLMVVTWILVSAIFIINAKSYGFEQTGLSSQITQVNETLKAVYYLYLGLLSLCIALSIINMTNKQYIVKIAGVVSLSTIIIQIILMHSRGKAIALGLCGLMIIQIGQKNVLKVTIMTIVSIILTFYLVSLVRNSTAGAYDRKGQSIVERIIGTIDSVMSQSAVSDTDKSLTADLSYRFNAFEWSAAILDSHENKGVGYMLGEDFFWGAYQAVPNVFLPFPKVDAEDAGNRHFRIAEIDQNSSIFGTAVADGGLIGIIIIFFLIGAFHGFIWRFIGSGHAPLSIIYGFFAIIPSLVPYDTSAGTHIFMSLRYWIIFSVYSWVLIKGCDCLMNILKGK